MKIKFNSDYKSPLIKTINIPIMVIVVRAVFHENNKYYPQVLFHNIILRRMFIKITKMLYYDRPGCFWRN